MRIRKLVCRPERHASKPSILIVTPTLGTSKFLDAAIESIYALDLDVRHILIAPQGKSHELAARYPRSTVLADSPASGMYGAIDEAVYSAERWDWFTYLNDDDLLSAAFATMAREHVAAGNHNVIAYGDVRWIDGQSRDMGLMPVERDMRRFRSLMTQGIAPFTQQGALVSRAVYESIGGFGTRFQLAADFSFWHRALSAGFLFRYAPHEVGCWRIHGSQLSMNRKLAAAEAASIAAAAGMVTPMEGRSARMQYYARNFGRYLERLMKTGCLTSGGIFAKHAN